MNAKTVFPGILLACYALAQVPVEKEPRHRLAFENESLRVLEPQIPAGDVTLEHLHAHDDATVCIHGSKVRAKAPGAEWSNPGTECMPGTVGFTEYSGKARSHTVENVGSGECHLTLVENLRPEEWTKFEPLTVAGLRLLRENRAFRAYDVQLPDTSTPLHSHPVPTVVVLVSGQAIAGNQRLDRPGQSVFIAAGKDHQVRTESAAHVIEIEVR